MIISIIKNLLFPVSCLICNQGSDCLCHRCFKRLKFGGPPRSLANLMTPSVDKIFIAGDYEDGVLAEIIKKYKYNFLSDLGPKLGQFLVLFWSGQLFLNGQTDLAHKPQRSYHGSYLDNFQLLTMPLDPHRYRWRGFNQVEALTEALVKVFSYPKIQGLKRRRLYHHQSSLSAKDRQLNIKSAFFWSGPRLQGENIILLDDVITTGATAEAAARVLKKAGAGLVYVLVLAKG